jgi:uncharacterized membrane protein (UPF0127 family)
MAYTIDVVHLDRERRIVTIATVKPWRFSRYVSAAESVLELRAGEACRLGLVPGMTPSLIEEGPRASRKVPGF